MTRRATLTTFAFLLVAASCSPGATTTFASLGTAGTGGIYYPLGGALARMLSEELPSVRFNAEVTGGSVENINRVIDGEMDLGMAIGTSLVRAREGDAGAASLRIVAPLYPNVAHVLVSASSAVTSVADLGEARVSIGAAGSGTEQMAQDILGAHGIEVGAIEARYLSFQESSNALRDGSIEAAIFSVGVPASSVLEATTAGGARLLPIADDVLATLITAHSVYTSGRIPSGSYPGVEADLPTAAVMNWVIATEALDGSVVRALLEVLDRRAGELVAVNDVARQIDLGALERAPLPLHPATAAWQAERR